MWEPLTMNLYSPITPSGAQAMMEWVRLSYESVTGRAGYSDFYKKDIVINVIGPPGDVVGEWILKGAFVKDGDFGSWDFGDDAPQELSMTIEMDYCVLSY